ncbi:UPF0014 family, partial [Thamnocephalis sphaerospora]
SSPLEWRHVLAGSTFVFFSMATSYAFGLQIEWPLFIASARCVVQLTVMGLVLENILNTDNVFLVLAMGCVFVVLAAVEIVYHKSKYRFVGMWPAVLLSIFVSCLAIGIVGNIFALDTRPFWDPYKFIPTLGMLVGNTMVSIAIAINSCTVQFRDRRECVEVQLAFGATRWETAKPIVVEAIRAAMLPTINSMSVMGLITIPGMMTGQILGGESPMSAIKYQQIIMFMVGASASVGSIGSVLATVYTCIDARHRLRLERVTSTA